MKAIKSLGGPLIGLSREHAALWSGNVGKRFIGEGSLFADDYEAAGLGNNQSLKNPWSIATLKGCGTEALVFSMPYETNIVLSDPAMVGLAQVIFSDRDDAAKYLTRRDFHEAIYDENVEFFCGEGGPFVLFDAAFQFNEAGEQFLEFELASGPYVLSSAVSERDDTRMILYCIKPANR